MNYGLSMSLSVIFQLYCGSREIKLSYDRSSPRWPPSPISIPQHQICYINNILMVPYTSNRGLIITQYMYSDMRINFQIFWTRTTSLLKLYIQTINLHTGLWNFCKHFNILNNNSQHFLIKINNIQVQT